MYFVGSLPTQMLRRKNRAAVFYCSNETYVISENDFWHCKRHLIPNGINLNKLKSFFNMFMRRHMQSDFTWSATQDQPELVLYHYILESVKLWDKSLTWHKVLMHPLKSDRVSSVYLHFPFIQTVLFESFTWYFKSLSLLYRRVFHYCKSEISVNKTL